MKKETRNTWKSYIIVVGSSRQTQVENWGWGERLEELRTPAPQLQIRHEHRDLAKVNQLAHNSTPPRPGVVITIYNQSAVGRVRQQDQKTGGQEQRVQGHIPRPCINKLRARAER